MRGFGNARGGVGDRAYRARFAYGSMRQLPRKPPRLSHREIRLGRARATQIRAYNRGKKTVVRRLSHCPLQLSREE
jgi:hypothetical protein